MVSKKTVRTAKIFIQFLHRDAPRPLPLEIPGAAAVGDPPFRGSGAHDGCR